jgi:hypothetical protein
VDLSATLTAQFYAWEQRGRGWACFPHRVALEPQFVPFQRGSLRPEGFDDGRQPRLWERLWSWLTRPRESDQAHTETQEPPQLEEAGETTELQVRLPADTDISGALADELLLVIASVSRRTSFELVHADGRLTLQYAVATSEAAAIQRVIEAYVPGAVVTASPLLRSAWEAIEGDGVAVDFGLRQEFMLPLPIRRSLAIDPLLGLIAALEGVGPGEAGAVQVLFQAARVEWAAHALQAMTDGEGRAFFMDAPETLAQTREKLSRPLLACVIRVAARAIEEERSWELVRTIGRAVMAVYGTGSNDLIPLEADSLDLDEHEEDLLDRATHRHGMLLSSAELSGLVHLPAAVVEADDLRASAQRTRAAPEGLHSGEVSLGQNTHRGRSKEVWLRAADRIRHVHIIGATGTGKSTLLKHLIRQDLEAGRGLALLDPHGDLADEVLSLVPDNRLSDVVLFDPADEEYPVGFNVLDAHSDRERELLSSDLVWVFKRFSTSWGDQMSAVLGNAVLAFLETSGGGSLLDLRRFLMDRPSREAVLATVQDPLVTSFWREEFPRLTGRPQMPIVTRLDAFLRPKAVRNIVSQRKSRFDLGQIMDQSGIFIARLSQGAIGEQNAHLLGSLLVAKFQQMALARERQAEVERRPFLLYIDEFHYFTTPSIASLLSGARKYRLGLVLAHQDLRQLGEHEIKSAVLTNAGTRICYRVSDEDARVLASGFRHFEAVDLACLGIGQALGRVGPADQDFSLSGPTPLTVNLETSARRTAAIRERTRARYGTTRQEVEAVIAQWGRTPEPDSVVQPVERARRETSREVPGTSIVDPQPLEIRRCATPKVRVGLGKGGPAHKYLQSLLKNCAESKGFRVTVEAPAASGGAIDLLMERDALTVACEISVTTEPGHEAANVRKCLESNATHVLVVSSTAQGLQRIEKAVSAAGGEGLDRVAYLAPADVLGFLAQLGPATPEARTVRGYKVKTSVEGPAAGGRKSTVGRTIVQALRRIRGK